MGLTKERKIFLGLAGVATIALIADQGIFGTQSASADALPIEQSPVAEQLEGAPTLAEHLPAAQILIDRLGEHSNATSNDSLGSIFSLTKLIDAPATEPNSKSDDESMESYALIPPTAHDLPMLSAVMPSKNGGGAVLGGKIMRVGQVDGDGYQLIDVHQRSVIVERDGVKYTIEIPRHIED